MHIKSMELVWIVVNDLKKAINFYTETVGLKLMEENEGYGWAELQGHEGGARLGIAQTNAEEVVQPGSNAVVTLTVENIEKALEGLNKKGAKLRGDLKEIPGHVKMQSVEDRDGNHFQLVQILKEPLGNSCLN
ncbi:MAG: VOC family protein [Rhabdochlamydiaceae bacterium]|jgi:predicted enzyme related to lactoylglutathione lyase